MNGIVSFDSNILVYAELEPETEKGCLASSILELGAGDGILTAQALLEYVAAMRRRRPATLSRTLEQAGIWSSVFPIAPTTLEVFRSARGLVVSHRLQVWDAVILSAARAGGARTLFSEDMHDGLTVEGITVVNPFAIGVAAVNRIIGG